MRTHSSAVLPNAFARIPGIGYDADTSNTGLPSRRWCRYRKTLSDTEAAPLLCAGITTYNSLRHNGATPVDLVAVQGIGGLGHLGIQFANKFGYKKEVALTPLGRIGQPDDIAPPVASWPRKMHAGSPARRSLSRVGNDPAARQ
jgi:hypothetical protein